MQTHYAVLVSWSTGPKMEVLACGDETFCREAAERWMSDNRLRVDETVEILCRIT